MTNVDYIDVLAAEYALGTLDDAERSSVAAHRRRDLALDLAIEQWEARLAPLAQTISSEEPRSASLQRLRRASRSGTQRLLVIFRL